MAYPVLCLLPYYRYLHTLPDKSVRPIEAENLVLSGYFDDMKSVRLKVQMKECDYFEEMDLDSVGNRFGFVYCSRNVFLHEREYRNSCFWAIDPDGIENCEISNALDCPLDETVEMRWKELVLAGVVSRQLAIKYVSDEVGYGLFADADLPQHEFIGEYVGIVYSAKTEGPSDTRRYLLSFPSCDGNVNIDATEQGNMIRFINHCSSDSQLCNVMFTNVLINGSCCVICVTTRPITRGAQLLVDYGSNFWVGKSGMNEF